MGLVNGADDRCCLGGIAQLIRYDTYMHALPAGTNQPANTPQDRTSPMPRFDDDMVLHFLPFLTGARDSKNASLVCKQWLAHSHHVWRTRISMCVASEGLQWRPSLAVEIEAHLEHGKDLKADHFERVRALPFVMGLTPAPAGAMWAKTKPTLMGGQQVYLNNDGKERDDGTWGCNESVADFGCDSNWNRGFVWGVMNFEPDRDKQLGYYPVARKLDDDLDPRAIVSQYPLAVTGSKHEYDGDGKYIGFGFLGDMLAFYASPFFRSHRPALYFIGGRLLRMSEGNSEESVMGSLGFVRNPAVAPDDFENEARWCRLPIMEGAKPPDENDLEGARLFDLNFPFFSASEGSEGSVESAISDEIESDEYDKSDESDEEELIVDKE